MRVWGWLHLIPPLYSTFTKFMYHEWMGSNTKETWPSWLYQRRTTSQLINWNKYKGNNAEEVNTKCKMKNVYACVSTMANVFDCFYFSSCEVHLTNQFEEWHTSIRWRGSTVGKARGSTPDSCIKKTVSWLHCWKNKMRKRSRYHVKIPAVEVMCTTWRQGCEDLHHCLLSWW